jgi:hypothetical protein
MMALEHSAEVDTIIGRLSIRNSAEGSANDAMAIEFPNTSWLQRNVAGGDKFKLV